MLITLLIDFQVKNFQTNSAHTNLTVSSYRVVTHEMTGFRQQTQIHVIEVLQQLEKCVHIRVRIRHLVLLVYYD